MRKNPTGIWMLAVLLVCLAAPAVGGADGLIIVSNPTESPPGHFGFAPLQVLYHHVNVTVKGLVAVTEVDQGVLQFQQAAAGGHIHLPGSSRGAHRQVLHGGWGKIMTGEMLPADKARALYEDIVRRQRDPALLEYAGRGAYTLRIFPIEPQAGKRIRISYTQLLTSDSGMAEYVYTLGTEKFSSSPVSEVSVKMTIDGEQPLKTVYSPSHRRGGETPGRQARPGWLGGQERLAGHGLQGRIFTRSRSSWHRLHGKPPPSPGTSRFLPHRA